MRKILKIKISDKCAVHVYEDIARGSEPRFRFYNMVAASSIPKVCLGTIGFLMDDI